MAIEQQTTDGKAAVDAMGTVDRPPRRRPDEGVSRETGVSFPVCEPTIHPTGYDADFVELQCLTHGDHVTTWDMKERSGWNVPLAVIYSAWSQKQPCELKEGDGV